MRTKAEEGCGEAAEAEETKEAAARRRGRRGGGGGREEGRRARRARRAAAADGAQASRRSSRAAARTVEVSGRECPRCEWYAREARASQARPPMVGGGICQQKLDQGGARARKAPFGRKALIDEELEDGAGQVVSETIRAGSPASATRQEKSLAHARARGPAVGPGAEGAETPVGRGSEKQQPEGNSPLRRDCNCRSKDS